MMIGIGAIVIGVVTLVIGFMWAHFTGLSELDDLGREIYPAFPRGWQWELLGQVVALGGALLAMAGATLAFLYDRPVTWARASLGAALFTGLMMILYGIIPNQWLTLTQAVWEWTPQKTVFQVPESLVLGNELKLSAAAVKDIVSGTYVVVVTGVIAVAMYKWQERQKKLASGPPPTPVSPYGRPMTKIDG
jgi:hypothetical protein